MPLFIAIFIFFNFTSFALAKSAQMHCELLFVQKKYRAPIYPGIYVIDQRQPNFYKVFDVKHDFSFLAELTSQGELELNLYLADFSNKKHSGLFGPRLYREAVEHFGVENIKTIIGKWSEGTNFEQYRRWRSQGLPPEESALKTWSGRQASFYGFRRIQKIDDQLLDEFGHPIIYVEFVRP